jgi:hypothetical protein
MSDTPVISRSNQHSGAPIGNTNALRHGFYAKNLGGISPRQLDEAEMRNLLGEVAMLKDYMYTIYIKNLDSTDNATLIDTLHALSLAGLSLARLLQVHNDIRIYGKTNIPLDNLLTSLDATVSQMKSLEL